jgi:phenylalanyl-tRNA synthetase beta chain
MKIPISWLHEYLETDASIEVIANKLTDIGLEVEEIINNRDKYNYFKVAEIIETEPHPNADRLKVCSVNDGREVLQIICGAPNARAGIKVVLARVGVIIPASRIKIKKTKIRGVESNGMLCSAYELQLGKDADGILELEAELDNDILSALGLEEYVIDIAITPNRGDCLSIYGIARDLAAAGIGKLIPVNISETNGNFKSPIGVKNLAPDKSRLFVGRYFRGIRNVESPKWLKRRLESVGIASISALVDISNYATIALGRPSHIYDADKLSGNLCVTTGKKGNFSALNGQKYQIIPDDIVIADEYSIHAVAGIIGGEDSKCSNGTSNIFLEIAIFNHISVALTGRRMRVQTESRYRFERGVDSGTTSQVLNLISSVIIQICGGEVSEPVIAGNINIYRHNIEFNPSIIKNLIGIELQESESILLNLGFEVNKQKEGSWIVCVPSWRNDVNIPADLVEEIIRIYGYSNLPSTNLSCDVNLLPEEDRRSRIIYQARQLLASRGLNEVITWSFMSSKIAKAFGLESQNLQLLNPISSDLDMMRPSIIPNLLEAALRNFNHKHEIIKLFELGPIYNQSDRVNKTCIAAIRAGKAFGRNIHLPARDVNIFDVKSDLLSLFEYLNLPDTLPISTENPPCYYHPGKFGAFYLGKTLLAYFGALSLDLLSGIPAVAFELFIDNIPHIKPRNKRAFVSKYQPVSRDFSFILDTKIAAIDIVRAVNKIDKMNLIQDIEIFDVYQGRNIPHGKKSVAFNIVLQATDHTLNSEEINKVSDAVVDAVCRHLGGVPRLNC